ncbi:MAG: hypothetical protein R3F04_14310, partial [Lysobacteraceae bacterium]
MHFQPAEKRKLSVSLTDATSRNGMARHVTKMTPDMKPPRVRVILAAQKSNFASFELRVGSR